MRLLLVEDDLDLQQHLNHFLVSHQFSVDVASDGREGLFLGQEYPYDAAIIDLGLPYLDGVEMISQLRKEAYDFPVIILTARDSWQEKVKGLDAGADDYLTKPFQPEELLARLNALIRRSAGKASPVITNGVLSLNTSTKQVKLENVDVSLSSSEYKLLEYFMLHLGEVTSKTKLTEHIYDQDFDLDSNVIEVFIRRLRKKLDPENKLNLIETLRGQGYKLNALSEPN